MSGNARTGRQDPLTVLVIKTRTDSYQKAACACQTLFR